MEIFKIFINQEESLVYKNLLKKKGILVKSVSETIPEGIYGSLIERIIEWMDEFYSINLGVEVVRGMEEKISRGEPTCSPPFGYSMIDKKYIPNEDAKLVVEIFERFANGQKQREIAILIGSYGIRTRYGNPPDNRWIDYILNNPVYIGKLRWSKDGARAVSKRHYNDESVITVDGNHQAIISIELWNKVQEKIKEQKKTYPKYARKEQPVEYMLKGLVRCSSCGSTLACQGLSKKSKHRSLQCCNYARGSCKTSHSITLPKIEEALILGLKQALKEEKFKIDPKSIQLTEKEINYNQLIEIEQRKLHRAKEAYLSGIDSIDQYRLNKAEIEEKIAELERCKGKPKTKQFDTSKLVSQTIKIIDFIQREDVSAKAKNEMLRTIIDKIIFDKPNETLSIYFKA